MGASAPVWVEKSCGKKAIVWGAGGPMSASMTGDWGAAISPSLWHAARPKRAANVDRPMNLVTGTTGPD
jgi:hypothetical protein